MKKRTTIIMLSFLLSVMLVGCNIPIFETPVSQVDLLNTAAAQTIQAQQTSIAQTSQPTLPEPTLTGTQEPTLTETPEVIETPTPTLEPTAVFTPTKQAACDVAAFVSETVLDGSSFSPGESFTKTWTLKNVGSCTWTSDYDVIFLDGNAMNAPAAKQLTTGSVEPGQSVVISFDLKAPLAAGSHRGDFLLRNASGATFGISEQIKTFWVAINVKGSVYDFTKNMCASGVVWRSSAGILPCPGKPGDATGYVRKIDEPTLENGVIDDEPGMHVHPEMVTNGWIKGIYPEITVTKGVYFKAIVGCNGKSDCDVKFKLNYRIEGGNEETLATWHEVQDGKFNRVKVDLNSLAGKKVQFILVVDANGSAKNDNALWFGPRIEP